MAKFRTISGAYSVLNTNVTWLFYLKNFLKDILVFPWCLKNQFVWKWIKEHMREMIIS